MLVLNGLCHVSSPPQDRMAIVIYAASGPERRWKATPDAGEKEDAEVREERSGDRPQAAAEASQKQEDPGRRAEPPWAASS